jgi:homoserine O-acetyltransferase
MGLEAARAIALLSYRHYDAYRLTQSEDSDEEYQNFKASSYQQYQGLKLRRRFDPDSYFCLTRSMDSHNLGRGRNGVDEALASIQAKALIIGIDSDLLFPLVEQVELAEKIRDARLYVIESTFGHDGFLVELESIGTVVMAFLENRIEGAAFSANGLAPRLGSIALPGSETF